MTFLPETVGSPRVGDEWTRHLKPALNRLFIKAFRVSWTPEQNLKSNAPRPVFLFSAAIFVAAVCILVSRQYPGRGRRAMARGGDSLTMTMTIDRARSLGLASGPIGLGVVSYMRSASSDARWRDAILLTLALWLAVAIIFLPTIIIRHWDVGIGGMALDFSTYVISFAFAMAMFWVFRKTVEWPQTARILILIATVFAAAVSNTLFDLVYTDWVAANVQSSFNNFQRTLERGYPSALNYTLVFGVNMAFFQLSFARRRELRQERQLVDARSAAQQAQLAALRYQLNPHFLFNTLNSISALIVTRRNEDAEVMTDKLSSFLRTSLACDPAELVPLEHELSLIEEYLDIEGVRFGERLNVEIDCPPDAGKSLVPGFLVQPLVENAVKHGVAPSRDPVTITVRAEIDDKDLCITVTNDHSGSRMVGLHGTGVGLINIERRLAAVYGKAASLTTERSDDFYTATICIPGIQRAD
jgi:hypothetical protein